jgi:HK97 family phage prohead protease
MDELTNARSLIEQRRSSPRSAVLTKDAAFVDDAGQELVKAESPEEGILEGYSTRWWVVDSYGEFTIPGAFARSIAERGPKAEKQRIVLRYEHEHTIGKHVEMVEDDIGVHIKAKVSNDGMWGSVLRAHLRDEIPYGLSIGFRRMKERPATEADPLILDFAPDYIKQLVASEGVGFLVGLQEIKHLEDSPVTFPAVEPATVDSYRADILDLPQRHIDALLRDAQLGRLTNDHITSLRAFAQQLPAASISDGETPKPDAPQTADQRRNYMAEARYLLQRAGAPVWE